MRKAAGIILACWLACMAATLTGCKPRVPKEYLQPGEMEAILYDYLLADGMAYTESNYQDLALRRQAYREAAIRKHGVTTAKFDSSLVYYYRHTKQLHDIYQKISKRLNNDAIALGATASELSQFEGVASQGDTATVWTNTQTVILMPEAPYNYITFNIKADSTYHEGDKMILSFDSQFLYQNGMRDGVAMLTLTFANDSTASSVMHCSRDEHFSLQLQDNNRLGIKRVSGFVYLGKGNETPRANDLKVMAVSNLKLMKMHTTPPEEKEADTASSEEEPTPMNGDPKAMPPRMRPKVDFERVSPDNSSVNADKGRPKRI